MSADNSKGLREAYFLYYTDKFREAISLCDQLLQSDPEDFEALFLKIRCDFFLYGYDSAQTILENSFISGSHEESTKLIGVRGWLHQQKGEKDKALHDYDEVIRLNPKFAKIYLSRALLLTEAGEFNKALDDYNKSIVEDPEDYYAYLNRSVLLANKLNNDNAALEDLKKSITLENRNPGAYAFRGALFADQNKNDLATSDFERSLAIEPNNLIGIQTLGKLYLRQGKSDTALNTFLRGLRISPSDVICNAYVSDIFKKRGDILNALRYHSLAYKDKSPDFDAELPESQFFAEEVSKHLKNFIYPELKRLRDSYVDHWFIGLTWGRNTSTSIITDGNSSYVHSGTSGAGYLLLSQENLWLVSLGEVSKRYIKKPSLFKKVALAFLSNFDFRNVEKDDKLFVIPYAEISSISGNDNKITVLDGNERFEIYPGSDNDFPIIMKSIMIMKNGELTKVQNINSSDESGVTEKIKNSNVLATIEGLKKLLDQGVLSEEEFIAKKCELLKRL